MTWQVPFVLGGPVLHRELSRPSWQLWASLLRCGYALFLLVEFAALFPDFSPRPQGGLALASSFEARRQVAVAWAAFSADYLSLLLYQQLILLLLLTPAVTAGALGREKEKDTLSALLTTQLGPWQILTGKLLGRLLPLAYGTLPALPFLAFAAVGADVGMDRLLLALAQAAVLGFAVAAACLLTSVWTRRASDAILACYSAVVVGAIVSVVLLSLAPPPPWLNPVATIDGLVRPEEGLTLGHCLLHLAFWAAVGAGCFALAAFELAPAARRQADRHVSRWLWALRPAVGNDPVRWRERHVLGLAPLPMLRMVPGWIGLLGVLVFSAVFAADGLNYAAGSALRVALERGDFTAARDALGQANEERAAEGVNVMGVVLLGLGALIVGVRCAGSIAEEKRRKTWEDLLLTPLSLEEIVAGKKWGVLQSAIAPGIVYALPMFALASVGGPWCIVRAVLWMGGAAIVLVLAARFGAIVSLEGETRDDSPRPLRSYVPRPEERGKVTDPWAVNEHVAPDRRWYTS